MKLKQGFKKETPMRSTIDLKHQAETRTHAGYFYSANVAVSMSPQWLHIPLQLDLARDNVLEILLQVQPIHEEQPRHVGVCISCSCTSHT